MKDIYYTTRFKRDVKRIIKRGKDLKKLEFIVTALRSNKPLSPVHKPHKLTGEWRGFWECHIEPDWLLVYDVTDDTVMLAGTGTHTDLFK